MASPQELAALFARTLDLFRDPSAKEDQKAQFRMLASLLKTEAVTLASQDGRLIVNGTPLDDDGPHGSLGRRLDFHSVSEITIPADPPLTETFELLRALADQPGSDDIATRLRASGTHRISVAMQGLLFSTPGIQIQTDPIIPSKPTAPRQDLGTGGLLHGEMGDVASVPLAGVPLVSHDVPPPPGAARRGPRRPWVPRRRIS